MAITFDPSARRIILDANEHTAGEIWSRWYDWFVTGDNSKHPVAFRQVGGDDLGGGLFIPVYFFLLNGWRVRPREANHSLVITGNLFVDGGGNPLVNTLGSFNVLTQLTVPVQAQAYDTGGGGGGGGGGSFTATDREKLEELHLVHGLQSGSPLIVTPTSRVAGAVSQQITEAGNVVTVSRL